MNMNEIKELCKSLRKQASTEVTSNQELLEYVNWKNKLKITLDEFNSYVNEDANN